MHVSVCDAADKDIVLPDSAVRHILMLVVMSPSCDPWSLELEFWKYSTAGWEKLMEFAKIVRHKLH
jgi:hypothetical protein